MGSTLKGFLVSLPAAGPAQVRGWPDRETVSEGAVWFHGYLTGAAALRRALGLHAAASCGQIVAAGWQRWGTATPERITGEYAAVVVTDRDAVLLGDRMALRPLYCADAPDGTYVSTDLGALTRETGAWRDLDEHYMADVISTGMHLGTHTPYRDVRRLGVGELAIWRPGRLRYQGGWQPTEDQRAGSFAEHQELLRDTVERAVTEVLSSEGGLAVELSGGLDTSTVLAEAAAHGPVHAFSFVHPGDPGSDESSWIRAALAVTPASWHPIDATEHGSFTAGPELHTFLPAPSRRIINWAPNAAEDAAAAQHGVSTILTGEGGDAVFFAGLLPWYLADLLRTGRLNRLRREALRWSAHSDLRRSSAFWVRRAGIDGVRRWRAGQPLTIEPLRPLAVSAPWLRPAYIEELNALRASATDTGPRARSVHGQATLENILRCAEFARGREIFAVGAVEFRHPLLASSLIDLAMSTPWSVAVDPRIDRAVQRYAFAGRVAETVLKRRSKPLADEAILRGLERQPEWREFLVEDPCLAQRGYIDADAWTDALRSPGRVGGVAPLYAAIQLEVWLRHLRHAGTPVLVR